MPKLIIPNAYELYQSDSVALTQDEINARYFYNLRFLWLLETGDAILLPKAPANGFLAYLAKIKNIDPDTLHLVILEDRYVTLNSAVLSDPILIAHLRAIIQTPFEWQIQACYFTQEILMLAEKLHLPIDLEWQSLVKSNFIKQINSKAQFRKISISNNIPIPEGRICQSWKEFAKSMKHFLKTTGQVITKQEYNASGKGNIGISCNEGQHFVGVSKTIIIPKDHCINEIAYQLWVDNIHSLNKLLMIEVYYSNKGSVTAQFWSPPKGQEPWLISYSEIIMESRWVGVQIPPRTLSPEQTKALLTYSKQLACLVQAQGYQGYLCCDAIITDDDQILFTEINVRPGAETHAYLLAQHLFGTGYEDKMVVLTRNGLTTDSFIRTYQYLEAEDLILNTKNNTGIVLLTVDDTNSKQCEYLIAAPDSEIAFALQNRLRNGLHSTCEEGTKNK